MPLPIARLDRLRAGQETLEDSPKGCPQVEMIDTLRVNGRPTSRDAIRLARDL